MIVQQQQQKNQQSLAPNDELILVVPRSALFTHKTWQGLFTQQIDTYIQIIKQNQYYLPRSLMEQDPTYKQIIPYLIFRYNNCYFLMQRKSSSSEQRLKNKYTLGIGGHIRQEDMINTDSIFDWARREFHEEVVYNDQFSITTIGLLNDDTNTVGQVHLGLVLLLEGKTPNITVKSELKQGTLLTLPECMDYYDRMESWSQFVMTHLQTQSSFSSTSISS